MRNKRKLIIIVASILLMLAVGSTIAYLTTSDTFENVFNTASCAVKAQETFSSPSDWKPGDETAKTVSVTSQCSSCLNARVSYTEKWEDKDGNELSLIKNGRRVAIINFDNTSDWELIDGYYYYKNDLANGDTTSSFIKSVTYNPDLDLEKNCSTTTTGKECVTSYGDYDNAKYTLTITVETISCDSKADVWNTGQTPPDEPEEPVAPNPEQP